MIEKFTKDEIESAWAEPVAGNIQSIYGKINEICDIINAIQKEREAERFEIQEWIGILEAVRKSVNIHEKQIDELQMKLEPEKCESAENVQDETLKCPFCQQELVRYWGMEEPALYCCDNPKCSRGGVATESSWQELIRTRKALGIAVDTLEYIRRTNPISFHFEAIEKALEQITALEQKGK